MDLKENCRAWHSRLEEEYQHPRTADAHGKEIQSLREVPGGLLVLRLLFGEKASQGDNVSVDLLLGYRSRFAVTLRHFWVILY